MSLPVKRFEPKREAEAPEETASSKNAHAEEQPAEEISQIVENLEPWENPVSIIDLIAEIESRLKRHIIMPPESRLALTMWTVASYCYDSFRIFPRVVLHSPEKRCGKTTTMELIHASVFKGILASNVSPAAVFRLIEEYNPTLIIDEADSFLRDNEQLRGIINSSHTKSGAFVIRCDGDKNEVKKFSTWAPIVLGGIKRVADTIEDRSLVIELQRKMPGESVERLPPDISAELVPLRRKLIRWANENHGVLKTVNPVMPEIGNDRANDNWFPLFAVAEIVGSDVLERIQNAFLKIEGREKSETIGTTLLSDIRDCFLSRNMDKIRTKELIGDLISMEERPWESWRGGFTSRVLSNLLKDFGVRSKDIRISGHVAKGYELAKLKAAFRRYLPDLPQN
ncbi:DUF3631 domain-containing protein [Akkermansiaceae bacterium]|nr:DUF3631 domain-containing protein [Akkermansiaceae bacterium]